MEVEVFQRLVVLEVRATDSLLQLLAVAAFDLVGEESNRNSSYGRLSVFSGLLQPELE